MPRTVWKDPDAYDVAARRLAAMFEENFDQYRKGVDRTVAEAGPG
jgi:phosphoenolpyruvate carboxykinase (ATP)